MNKLAVCSVSIALALGSTYGLVLAQDKIDENKMQDLKKMDPVPPATGKNPSDQAGTQEPSTKGPVAKSHGDVFVNGSLAIPNAPTDTETTPSRYSARNAASDWLPIAAFRLKRLTDDQRREIYQQLSGERGGLALSPGGHDKRHTVVGAQLPPGVDTLRDVTPMPEAAAAKFPELRDAAFMSSGTKVLIVDVRNRLVFGVLSAQ